MNEFLIDYNQLIAQIQNSQRTIASKVDNLARQFDGAREVVSKKIIGESTKYMNIIRQNKTLEMADKTTLLTQIQQAVSTASNELQTISLTAQNQMLTNNMQSNTADSTKVLNLVKELQISQGNLMETIMNSIHEVPSQMNAQWAAVESILKDVDPRT